MYSDSSKCTAVQWPGAGRCVAVLPVSARSKTLQSRSDPRQEVTWAIMWADHHSAQNIETTDTAILANMPDPTDPIFLPRLNINRWEIRIFLVFAYWSLRVFIIWLTSSPSLKFKVSQKLVSVTVAGQLWAQYWITLCSQYDILTWLLTLNLELAT